MAISNIAWNCYTSWRDEKDFHAQDFEKSIEAYQNKLEEIAKNKGIIYPGEGTTNLLDNFDLEANRPDNVYDTLDSQRRQEEEDDLMEGAMDDPDLETFAYTGNLGQDDDVTYETNKYRVVDTTSDDKINFFTRRSRQVIGFCKDVLRSQKNLGHRIDPSKVIVHGGAGKRVFKKFQTTIHKHLSIISFMC